jgi:3-oxoacyl-[acyl-carrier-protein] synthase II
VTAKVEFRISGLSVLSPAGIGPDALGERLRQLASGASVLEHTSLASDENDFATIPGRISMVPDFDIADFVPKKGTKNLDRTTRLGIAASARLKQSLAGADVGNDWERTGVAIGSAGSLRSSIDFAAAVIRGEGIDLVNPATFPNTTMNCCASQIAIWHRMRGPNSTLANGSISSISALQYAARLIRCGHAEKMLVGGVEELSPVTAWGVRLKKEVEDSVFLGEGAAMVLLEVAGQATGPAAAVLSACEVLFAPERSEQGYAGALSRSVDRALASACITAADIDLVLPGATGTCLRHSEASVLDRFEAERVDVRTAVGECGSALGAMQLAAALLLGVSGKKVLITGLDVSGAVGAVVLTVGG